MYNIRIQENKKKEGMKMNKKVKGVILFIVGLFLVFLSVKSTFFISEVNRLDSSLSNTVASFFTLIFGQMVWFISIAFVVFGILNFYKKDFKLKQYKIILLAVWFLAWSVLLIRNSITEPIPSVFLDAGTPLLELGFNHRSGGLLGALGAMPLYRVILTKWIAVILVGIIITAVFLIFREQLETIYGLTIGLYKYYTSDEYKEAVRVLKAKKKAEKIRNADIKRKKVEALKQKIISARNDKISFELSKKPKNSIFGKTERYTPEELKKKEQEWIEFSEKQKKPEKSFAKQATEKIVEAFQKFPKIEAFDKAIDEEQERLKAEEEARQKALEEKRRKEQERQRIIEEQRIKEEQEKSVAYAKVEKEALEAAETEESSTSGEGDREGYDDLLKKAIGEIFQSKPMDENKREEIEKSIVENVSHLENVLKEFGIDAKVVNYEYGPTITRYEITIPKGVKVSKVTGLSDDIAMNLAAESIRIEAPIPGKNTIGIETPNKIKEPVHFSNMIDNPKLNEGELNVILGKDIVGKDKIIDISKMPHLLIAGQTGSGKSVAVNTLISTLISKKSEKETKFIMIDPKMVELMPYNGIPHLLVPVIIDPQQAAIALKWAVNEMENRYRQLMENGVRNIIGYNELSFTEKMPYIVIIIDELADLMMVASGSVEESIARIAQKARAVGIHLVVATQRPSTDVITGMIKANLPSRISFALRSQVDSRTILDRAGAEKLLGQGDMLLLENGSSKLERIQGAYISDAEVSKLAETLKKSKKVVYRNEILEETVDRNEKLDPFFENAVEVIKLEKKVSIALLQRKLNVGFNRASRIYGQLKENGVISDDNQILSGSESENEEI